MGDEQLHQQLARYRARNDRAGEERFLCGLVRRETAAGGDPGALIAACGALGALYRRAGRYPESLAAFRRALEETAAWLGEDCAQYAALLNNMAGTCRLAGDHPRAVRLFSAAAESCRRRGQGAACAGVLNNLALACREMGRTAEAAAALEEALALLEDLPGHGREAAVICSNLAGLYYGAGRRREAMACLDRALALLAEGGEDPACAAALNSLAGVLYAAGDYGRALETYERSARYTKQFFGETQEYAATLQNMRWVYEKLGRPAEARAALAAAERTLLRLLGPDHPRVRAVGADRARLERRGGGE